MSQQVRADFEATSIKLNTQCEIASNSLCKIDKTIERLKSVAHNVINEKIIKYENSLLDSKKEIQTQIDLVSNKLQKFKTMETKTVSDYNPEWNELSVEIAKNVKKLESMVAELTGAKLAVIDQMVTEGLISTINDADQKMVNQARGVKYFDDELLSKINAIEDISLRDLAYNLMSKGENDFETILKKAQVEYDKLLGRSDFIEDIKNEMAISGVPMDKINNITSKEININVGTEMLLEANVAIADEKIRKETLKIIIKTIRNRGFIVDTKNNLKIDRKTNILKLVAKKPDGKTAEFAISLNGKFMYRFDGYEGQACKKDIRPFFEDLKNIYDINVLHEEIQWSNPDKIEAQKYQYMNTNKGSN